MVDRGPLLTSAIIFYLAIGAAIFEVLEEPHWKEAKKNYYTQKLHLLKEFPCLSQEGLDKILQVVSDAADQGVAITGNQTFNNWNWPNAMIFAATVITTIGYGNVAPKTPAGRLFCVFYGLFGVPLCLTWISALGKFFGGRAKRLGQFLTRRGVSLRKAQITCTAIFIVWGVLVHLVIPPFVFMVTEEWNYIEGLYYSFITISTIGFGDFVAGVNPSANYHALYRYFVELWIYLGLAWLSLFVNWKVSMFVEVHKAIKKRRRRRKESFESSPHSRKALQMAGSTASKDVNIFSFLWWSIPRIGCPAWKRYLRLFENEETGLSDEETSKSSVEDNLTSKEQPEQGPMAEAPLSSTGEFPSSDESTFTSTESELSVPYEQPGGPGFAACVFPHHSVDCCTVL